MSGGSDSAIEDESVCHLLLGSYEIHELVEGTNFRNTLYHGFAPFDENSSDG